MSRDPSFAAHTAAPALPRIHNTLRPTLLTLAIHLAATGGLLLGGTSSVYAQPAADQSQQTQVRSYNIAAGSLDSVLTHFAAESGVLFASQPELVQGKHSPGLQGSHDAQTALSLLLAGTGLQAQLNAQGQYVLREIKDVASLPTMTISGKAPGSTTEGTGSYTTYSTSTSTRLNLSPLETPQSVSVLTRQRMDDQKLDNLPDALNAVTGITVKTPSPGGDSPQIWARSSTIRNFQIDGVPTSASLSHYLQSTAMYDRIEVARGATGLMNGLGYPSATINMIRKRPTASPQASISAEAGNWDRYGSGVGVSGPLTESGNFRGRVVADYKPALFISID